MRKINLLALVLFAACLAWVFTLDRGARGKIHGRVLGWFTPAVKLKAKLEGEGAVPRAELKRAPAELAEENVELRRELSELRIYRQRAQKLQEEVDKLSGMLGFMGSSQEKLIPARVISRTTSNWWSSLVVDKGSEDGVGTDLPVRNEQGIIGKTAQVSARSSMVILLSHEQCRVAAQIEGTMEQGIVVGTRGEIDSRTELRMRFLSKDAVVSPGLRVISSGAGGLFPGGVVLGTVREFISGDIYGEVIVDPAVDFSSVRDVFVIMREDVPGPIGVPEDGEDGALEIPVAPLVPAADVGSAEGVVREGGGL